MPDDNSTEPAPENVNHPDMLRITIASPEDTFDEAIHSVAGDERGEQPEAVVSLKTRRGSANSLPIAGSNSFAR